MRSVLAITVVELRRFFADRSNLFFVFIFPLAMVTVIGWQFGGDGPTSQVSVVAPEGSARDALVSRWQEADLEVLVRDDAATLREDVARGDSDVGVVIPEASAQAYLDGAAMELEIVQGTSSQAPAVAEVVRAQAEAVAVSAQQHEVVSTVVPAQEAGDALDRAAAAVAEPELLVVQPDSELAQAFEGAGQFGTGATAQLLLFVFLSTLTASAALIKARRDGVIRRTLSAPVTTAQTMLGLIVGRVAIGVFQGAYIMVASSLLFDVRWGDLRVTLVVLLAFALIAAGAAMVIGVVVDSEGAASGLSVGAGLVVAAIGGCMVPLELYPDRLRTIAHLTPHAWAYDALADIQRRGAGLVDVLPEVGVLVAMAVAVLALGALLLRRSLARAM